jgi:hypothetical protein
MQKMRTEKLISMMPSEQLVRRDREQYEEQWLALTEQITTLQALLTEERLKTAKLEAELQESSINPYLKAS